MADWWHIHPVRFLKSRSLTAINMDFELSFAINELVGSILELRLNATCRRQAYYIMLFGLWLSCTHSR